MLQPQSENELAEVIAGANGPLSVRGGGTRVEPVAGEVLTADSLSGIEIYEPGALTVVAKAGTTVNELSKTLAREGQQLAFEPPDFAANFTSGGNSTIGGVVASNSSGPRRIQAGAARDSLLGIRFVDGQGQITKNGGRVMKNVTGYDLSKLFAGSFGTLGVLTEVALKVLPIPETCATVRLEGLSPPEATKAMSSAMASPYDVSGAAHVRNAGQTDASTLLRIEGFERSVRHRAQMLIERLKEFAECEKILDYQSSVSTWAGVCNLDIFSGCKGSLWRVSVRPTDGPAVIDRVPAFNSVMDWAGGLVWLEVEKGTNVRKLLTGIGGHATLIRGAGQESYLRFQPEPPAIEKLSRGLREKFDPRGILNPGLMG